MRTIVFLLLAAVIVLSASLFLSRRGRRRGFDEEANGIEHETTASFGWDPLTSEVSGRIFDREDSDFVATETSQQITRQFRRERTALALDWLQVIRGQVNQLMRAHLKASRRNDELKPADEIKLWFEFFLFQLTSGILYLVISVCGPARAAELVAYSLGLVAQLEKVTKEALPAGRHVVAELMKRDQEPKNGDAVS